MLRILGHAASSNVQKVLWCCGELALPFERHDVGGTFGGNRTPEYLALNPNGLVPTVDDDGFILWESNVIVRYLAAKYATGAALALYPVDLSRRANVERWMDWQQTMLAAPMGTLFRALLRKSEQVDPVVLEAARAKATASWQILERALADRDYVAGAELTVGDIALGNAIHRWHRLPIERPALPRLNAWYRRLCERPAYGKYVASL